jgi:hypothetical protein
VITSTTSNWIKFEGGTRRIYGSPDSTKVALTPLGYYEEYKLNIFATDIALTFTNQSFYVIAVNYKPIIVNFSIPDVHLGSRFEYTINPLNLIDAENNVLTITAYEVNQTSLPFWITFNTISKSFSGAPLTSDLKKLYYIQLSVTDSINVPTTFDFTINVTNTIPNAPKT